MTIAVGILARDGVVVAADRQMTVPNYLKMDGGKVSFEARALPDPAGPTQMLIAGSGLVSSIEHIRQHLTSFLEGSVVSLSLSDIRAELDQQIKVFHHEHVVADGSGQLAVDMIVGAMNSSEKKLWVTERSIVNEESMFAAIETGAVYANILMGRLFAPMSTIGAVLLAAYVIHEVKQTVDGCGNDTDIFAASRGPVWVERDSVRKLESIFERYAHLGRNILHDTFNDQIGWAATQKRSHSSVIRRLRRDIEEIIIRIQALPEWAKPRGQQAPPAPTHGQ